MTCGAHMIQRYSGWTPSVAWKCKERAFKYAFSKKMGVCPRPGRALGGPAGKKFLSLVVVRHTESKLEVPLTLAVMAARHPLLDGVTHQVLL